VRLPTERNLTTIDNQQRRMGDGDGRCNSSDAKFRTKINFYQFPSATCNPRTPNQLNPNPRQSHPPSLSSSLSSKIAGSTVFPAVPLVAGVEDRLLLAPSFNFSHLRCALSNSAFICAFSMVSRRTWSSRSFIRWGNWWVCTARRWAMLFFRREEEDFAVYAQNVRCVTRIKSKVMKGQMFIRGGRGWHLLVGRDFS